MFPFLDPVVKPFLLCGKGSLNRIDVALEPAHVIVHQVSQDWLEGYVVFRGFGLQEYRHGDDATASGDPAAPSNFRRAGDSDRTRTTSTSS